MDERFVKPCRSSHLQFVAIGFPANFLVVGDDVLTGFGFQMSFAFLSFFDREFHRVSFTADQQIATSPEVLYGERLSGISDDIELVVVENAGRRLEAKLFVQLQNYDVVCRAVLQRGLTEEKM